ncbi:MAG: PilN domain-containing protein [Clostridia bacterium]
MASCLGIYLSDDILKYAKLNMDNNKNIQLGDYGIRYIKTTKKEAISNIIEETGAKDIPIAINPQEDIFVNIQLFDQAQNKAYITDVVRMEFEAWCEKNAKTIENYSYVYKISDLKNSENKHNGVLDVVETKSVKDITIGNSYKISNMYPAQLLINRLVPLDEQNYVLVNLDGELSISTIINGKLAEFRSYLVGMNRILKSAEEKFGNFAKSYEACKQLNVFSESDTTNNDKELERITEPILQEILREVQVCVNRNRKEVTKVYITGDGIVFTNLDILFREFLGIKCEILKPNFISDTSNVRNMAEILETTQAIALAYEALLPINNELNFVTANAKLKSKFNGIFSGIKMPTKTKNGEDKEKKGFGLPDSDKISTGLICASIVSGVILIAYMLFSGLYVSNVNKMLKDTAKQSKTLTSQVAEVKADAKYISSNTAQYKTINDKVQTVVTQIEENKIGKFTTYNVATFLQSVIKIIPKNVQLKTISSDDNKNVKITAQSTNYSDLGYFVAELKLQGVLNSVKINSIKNGDVTVIEIGGELP